MLFVINVTLAIKMSHYGCMMVIPKTLYDTYLTQGDRAVKEAISTINIRQLNNISDSTATVMNNDNFTSGAPQQPAGGHGFCQGSKNVAQVVTANGSPPYPSTYKLPQVPVPRPSQGPVPRLLPGSVPTPNHTFFEQPPPSAPPPSHMTPDLEDQNDSSQPFDSSHFSTEGSARSSTEHNASLRSRGSVHSLNSGGAGGTGTSARSISGTNVTGDRSLHTLRHEDPTGTSGRTSEAVDDLSIGGTEDSNAERVFDADDGLPPAAGGATPSNVERVLDADDGLPVAAGGATPEATFFYRKLPMSSWDFWREYNSGLRQPNRPKSTTSVDDSTLLVYPKRRESRYSPPTQQPAEEASAVPTIVPHFSARRPPDTSTPNTSQVEHQFNDLDVSPILASSEQQMEQEQPTTPLDQHSVLNQDSEQQFGQNDPFVAGNVPFEVRYGARPRTRFHDDSRYPPFTRQQVPRFFHSPQQAQVVPPSSKHPQPRFAPRFAPRFTQQPKQMQDIPPPLPPPSEHIIRNASGMRRFSQQLPEVPEVPSTHERVFASHPPRFVQQSQTVALPGEHRIPNASGLQGTKQPQEAPQVPSSNEHRFASRPPRFVQRSQTVPPPSAPNAAGLYVAPPSEHVPNASGLYVAPPSEHIIPNVPGLHVAPPSERIIPNVSGLHRFSQQLQAVPKVSPPSDHRFASHLPSYVQQSQTLAKKSEESESKSDNARMAVTEPQTTFFWGDGERERREKERRERPRRFARDGELGVTSRVQEPPQVNRNLLFQFPSQAKRQGHRGGETSGVLPIVQQPFIPSITGPNAITVPKFAEVVQSKRSRLLTRRRKKEEERKRNDTTTVNKEGMAITHPSSIPVIVDVDPMEGPSTQISQSQERKVKKRAITARKEGKVLETKKRFVITHPSNVSVIDDIAPVEGMSTGFNMRPSIRFATITDGVVFDGGEKLGEARDKVDREGGETELKLPKQTKQQRKKQGVRFATPFAIPAYTRYTKTGRTKGKQPAGNKRFIPTPPIARFSTPLPIASHTKYTNTGSGTDNRQQPLSSERFRATPTSPSGGRFISTPSGQVRPPGRPARVIRNPYAGSPWGESGYTTSPGWTLDTTNDPEYDPSQEARKKRTGGLKRKVKTVKKEFKRQRHD